MAPCCMPKFCSKTSSFLYMLKLYFFNNKYSVNWKLLPYRHIITLAQWQSRPKQVSPHWKKIHVWCEELRALQLQYKGSVQLLCCHAYNKWVYNLHVHLSLYMYKLNHNAFVLHQSYMGVLKPENGCKMHMQMRWPRSCVQQGQHKITVLESTFATRDHTGQGPLSLYLTLSQAGVHVDKRLPTHLSHALQCMIYPSKLHGLRVDGHGCNTVCTTKNLVQIVRWTTSTYVHVYTCTYI